MKEYIKKDLDKQFNNLITSDFSAIASKIDNKKGVILDMKKEKKFNWALLALPITAACAFVFMIMNEGQYTTVFLDVNPGIEMKVNDKGIVKEIMAVNNDATTIVNNLDVKNDNIKQATSEILDELSKNSYLTETKNSVLVSTSGEKANEVKNDVLNEINEYSTTKNLDLAVISQVVESNTQLENKATEYNMTTGKTLLIEKIVEKNPQFTFEGLAKLTTNELNLLLSSDKVIDLDNIDLAGTAHDSYIGIPKVIEIISTAENITGISNYEIEFDFDNNIMVYEVEFNHNNIEYEFEIDAVTGAIVEREVSFDDDNEIDDKDDDNNDNNDDDDDNDEDDDDNDDDDDDNDDDDNDDDDNDND